MTFGDMQSKVRRRLNESTEVFFTDDDIKDALNEGYEELADATEYYEREAMVPMLRYRMYYDLTRILPNTFLSPRRIFNPITNQWLEPVDPREQDNGNQWELWKGQPQRYLMRGNWWMGVTPTPERDSVGMRVYFTGIPDRMVEDDDEPAEIPQEFHEGIVEFAFCELLGQERETAKALASWKRYTNYQDNFQGYVNGRQAIAQKVVLGGAGC